MLELVSNLQPIILAAGDDDDGSWGALGLVFFLAGFVFYSLQYRRYRNADKRHNYERETEAKKLDVVGSDQKINTRKGLHNKKMKGANNTSVRGMTSKFF